MPLRRCRWCFDPFRSWPTRPIDLPTTHDASGRCVIHARRERVLVPAVETEPRLCRASRHAARFLLAHGGRASWPKASSARGDWLVGVFCQEINLFRSIAVWLVRWWVATGSILDRPDGAVRAQRKCSGTTAHLKPGACAQAQRPGAVSYSPRIITDLCCSCQDHDRTSSVHRCRRRYIRHCPGSCRSTFVRMKRIRIYIQSYSYFFFP